MPYAQRLTHSGLSGQDKVDLRIEFDLLRAELDNIRAKYAALLAKMDLDATIVATDWASSAGLGAKRFTPT